MTYLDTHVAAAICTASGKLSAAASAELDAAELRISPMVVLELQFLREIGRLKTSSDDFVRILRRDFEVEVCDNPWIEVTRSAVTENWTRDPFDRLIVAHARCVGGRLITRDRQIRKHFDAAVW